MDELLLTDEEIQFYHKVFEDEAHEHWHYAPKEIAKAQVKKAIELLEEK